MNLSLRTARDRGFHVPIADLSLLLASLSSTAERGPLEDGRFWKKDTDAKERAGHAIPVAKIRSRIFECLLVALRMLVMGAVQVQGAGWFMCCAKIH